MSHDAWVFFGTLVVEIAGIATLLIKLKATDRKAEDAKTAATDAATFAEPTGNGFAKEVRDGLAEIKAIATEARDEIRQHKNAHVDASMRSLL